MGSEATLAKAGYLSTMRREWLLGAAFATTALFLLFGKGWLADLSNPLWFTLMLVWLFAIIMSSAFAVVHHAESLAVRLGEPLGTLVLTLSVIGIEVMMISAVMLTGEGKPALARDTMFGIVMIVLNGMIGLALLLGGLRHHEQEYNLQGANSFLSLIVPLTVLGLVLPNFTRASAGPTLSAFQSVFLALMSIGIYSLFLIIQNWRHREYFVKPAGQSHRAPGRGECSRTRSGYRNQLNYVSCLVSGDVSAAHRGAGGGDCPSYRPWDRSPPCAAGAGRFPGGRVDLVSRVTQRHARGAG